MRIPAAPADILQRAHCGCKTSRCNTMNCSCKKAQLSCTELCKCTDCDNNTADEDSVVDDDDDDGDDGGNDADDGEPLKMVLLHLSSDKRTSAIRDKRTTWLFCHL